MQKGLLIFFNAGCIWAESIRLPEWNHQQIQRNERAMWVLGTWVAGNIAVKLMSKQG